MSVEFREVHPVLPVRDVQEALRYYTEDLGFQLAFRDCSDPDNYVGVRRGGAEVHLQEQQAVNIPAPGTLILRLLIDDPDGNALAFCRDP